jgi:hypothetical protein
MKVRGLSSEAPAFNLSVALVSVLELDPQLSDAHLGQNVRDPLDLKGGEGPLAGRPASHLQHAQQDNQCWGSESAFFWASPDPDPLVRGTDLDPSLFL